MIDDTRGLDDQGHAATPTVAKNLTHDELLFVVRAAMPAVVVGLAVLAALYTMYFAADLYPPDFSGAVPEHHSAADGPGPSASRIRIISSEQIEGRPVWL